MPVIWFLILGAIVVAFVISLTLRRHAEAGTPSEDAVARTNSRGPASSACTSCESVGAARPSGAMSSPSVRSTASTRPRSMLAIPESSRPEVPRSSIAA